MKNDLSRTRVEDSVKRVARMINMNECVIEELGWACDMEEWNDGVVCQLKEAQMLLGQSLATLVNWFDEPEDGDAGKPPAG